MAKNFNEIAESIRSQFQDLNGLHPGLWPIVPRMAAAAGVFLTVIVAGWFAYWSGQMEDIENSENQEKKLRDEFKLKSMQAANLPALLEQRKLVQQYVIQMEKQLPSQAEMAALVDEITNAGAGSGLQFESFTPGSPVVKDYYAELPIAIKVNGDYHSIGKFVADVAKLSRIVTLNNLTLSTGKDNLSLDVTAKTFRYLNPEEIATQAKDKKGGKK